MENNTQKKVVDQDIDLFLLFKSIGVFFDKLGLTVYRSFNFLKKHFVISFILICLGLGVAYYISINNPKEYKHTVVLVSNFGSNTYLYKYAENFNGSISSNPQLLYHVSNLEVKPIVDVFELISTSEHNLNSARYMSDNSIEVSKYNKNNNVEKLYKYHSLTYFTDVEDKDENIYKALISDINKDEYFQQRQKVEILETENKLRQQEESVENINGVFKRLGNKDLEVGKNINVESYSEINDLLIMKELLLKEINKTKVSLIEQTKVVYDTSKKLNINNSFGVLLYLLCPFLFLLFFLFLGWILRKANQYKTIIN